MGDLRDVALLVRAMQPKTLMTDEDSIIVRNFIVDTTLNSVLLIISQLESGVITPEYINTMRDIEDRSK